ncbi:S9 family peptidase [Sphingosinicellaceae bacterium]|nr:S9 family peptidase [Sphingosinicellaceae bacterium]
MSLLVTAALAGALAAVAPAPASVGPQPFEAADLYKLAMVTGPKVAPDGRHILFTRTSFDIQSDTRQGEVWLATLNGDTLEPHLLIGAGAKAGSAEWSPDGKRIAYIALFLGKPQLWVMTVSGVGAGVGRPITSLKSGPAGFAWSPDGSRLAFVARVEAAPRKIARMPDKPEGATWAPPPKLITDFSYRSDDSGYATAGADQLFVVNADGGSVAQLTRGDFDQVGDNAVSWTRDGSAILFSAMYDADRDLRARESDLFSVPAAGGRVTQLTNTKGSEADPRISPDGKTLAFTGALEVPTFYAQPDLWVMPLANGVAGGPARNLTRAIDRPVNDYSWSADGRGLYVSYNDAGLVRVAFVPLAGGKPKIVVPDVGGTRLYLPSSGGSFSEAGGTFAYTRRYEDRPAGLGIARGGKEVAHLDFNEGWRAGKRIGKLEAVHYTSADGLGIDGWVQYPPDFDPAKKYPLALEIHGGPNSDYGPMFSITHQLYAAAGYVVLFTNPRGSIGYGERFANAIDKAYPGKDLDDLMAGVDLMVKRPYIDARNLFIGGGSGGGVLTTYAIGKTDRFRAAAALRPVTDWTVQALTSDIQAETVRHWVPGNPWDNHEDYWRRSTLSLVGNVKTPTLLIDGEADYRTPIEQSEAYYGALKIRGIDTMMVRLPEAGHSMGRPSQWLASILTVVEWYDKYKVQ